MQYLICGILGVVLGFFVFYLLFRIANKNRLYKKLKAEGKRKIPKPNFTKAVLVAVLFTYFIGLRRHLLKFSAVSKFGAVQTVSA